MATGSPDFQEVDGAAIAVRHLAGREPGIVWLGGFRSDMLGTKAEALHEWAAASGRAFLRHDYSGHGESGGDFVHGTISKWVGESLAVFRRFSAGRQILVGSSMGAWIALRMIEELRKSGEGERVAGLVLLAPAPDFTVELIEPQLKKTQRRDLDKKGFFEVRSDYSDQPYVYTRALFEDGRENRVMTGPINTHCPVHVLQGLTDKDVPHAHALKLVGCMPSDDVTLSLVPDGDHRLSRPQDLALLIRAVEAILAQAGE
jgi:pimeloyl-ACP methyl ester carboxylesterase